MMGRRNMASLIRFETWTPEQVAAWLRGLDDVILPYVHFFLNNGIDGKKLFMLSHADLEKLNVTKLGHQELILESVGLLHSLRYGYETENLQSLALQLGCKARSLHGEIQAHSFENDINKANVSDGEYKQRRLSITILSSISNIISTLRSIVSWLDRSPFDGMYELRLPRKSIIKIGLKLLDISQKEYPPHCSTNEFEDVLMESCSSLAEICDDLVTKSRDPLVVQPVALELATITKKPGEELGLHIQSAYYGIHMIGGIKDLSPAELCGKIERGDEVIQVNHQTVVGWQLKKLVSTLKEKPKEVVLLLKKRPRHAKPFGHTPNRRKLQNKPQTSTLPKSMKKRRSRESEHKQARSSLQDFVSSAPTPEISSPKDGNDENETDNEVFRSGSESPQFQLEVDAKQRRATVSGGSPTLTRPVLAIENLDTTKLPSLSITSPEDTSDEIKDQDSKDEKDDLGNSASSPQYLQEFEVQLVKPVQPCDLQQHLPELSPAPKHSQSNSSESDSVPLLHLSPETSVSSQYSSPENNVATETSTNASSELADSSKICPEAKNASKVSLTTTSDEVIVLRYSQHSPPDRKTKTGAEIATDKSTPTLMKVTRLTPVRDATREVKEEKPLKIMKKVGFDACVKDKEETPVSYTCTIVGGVVQMIPMGKGSPSEPQVVKRRSKTSKRLAADRRISCKDLGKGDCEGWLYKKKQGTSGPLLKNWKKRWCVLKDESMFYYKKMDDLKAEGVIHLPAFQVSPAPEMKSRKFAFKIHNGGTTFYFASERQDDMSKWMNKMGLAAISFDMTNVCTTGGFSKPEPVSPPLGAQNVYYSESEDDCEDPMKASTISLCSNLSGVSPTHESSDSSRDLHESSDSSTDDLKDLCITIEKTNLTIYGSDKVQRRVSRIRSADLASATTDEQRDKMKKICRLQRILKDRQQELDTIENLLTSVTPQNLQTFLDSYGPGNETNFLQKNATLKNH